MKLFVACRLLLMVGLAVLVVAATLYVTALSDSPDGTFPLNHLAIWGAIAVPLIIVGTSTATSLIGDGGSPSRRELVASGCRGVGVLFAVAGLYALFGEDRRLGLMVMLVCSIAALWFEVNPGGTALKYQTNARHENGAG